MHSDWILDLLHERETIPGHWNLAKKPMTIEIVDHRGKNPTVFDMLNGHVVKLPP